jgi:hypothetical protein
MPGFRLLTCPSAPDRLRPARPVSILSYSGMASSLMNVFFQPGAARWPRLDTTTELEYADIVVVNWHTVREIAAR